MVVLLYGFHKFMTILLRCTSYLAKRAEHAFLKKKKKVSSEPIHTLCIVSFCMLGPVYMDKSCPGKEGHPSSRVNFASVYMNKTHSFVQAKSARSYSDFAAITSSHIIFFNFSIQSKGNSRIRRGTFGRSLFERSTTVMDEDLRLVTWRVLGCRMLPFNQETE